MPEPGERPHTPPPPPTLNPPLVPTIFEEKDRIIVLGWFLSSNKFFFKLAILDGILINLSKGTVVLSSKLSGYFTLDKFSKNFGVQSMFIFI